MDKDSAQQGRNLFEIDNARNISRDDLVETFVPTLTFSRLLTAKNQIILGARGSGKTALAKMISHDHLSRFNDTDVKRLIKSQSFIGIYVPTGLEWVGSLRTKPKQTDAEAEEMFKWQLNISVCLAFLVTLRSCLDTYIKDRGRRANIERTLAEKISLTWFEDRRSTCSSVYQLRNILEDVYYKKHQQKTRLIVVGHLEPYESPIGVNFQTDPFMPLRQAIAITTRELELPHNCNWILCIDEAEFLEEMHHRILYSHMRSHSGNLFFKVTTMPYVPNAISTNTPVPANAGHDFDFVYIDEFSTIDSDASSEYLENFANTLFNKLAKASGGKYTGITLQDMLGVSELLDRKSKRTEWQPNSDNMRLLKKYASQKTISRAERLSINPREFSDQIARKIHGALLLRHAVESKTGRAEIDVYSGATMAIRCSDGNPRRLISIFNRLLLECKLDKVNKTAPLISRKAQTRVLIELANSTLSRTQSEPECGRQLYDFLNNIGSFMRYKLHACPLATDQISSITIDKNIPEQYWKLIQRAVGLALLFPNINVNNPDQLPEREGTFHVAYILSPLFRTLPRKGQSQKLTSILFSLPETFKTKPKKPTKYARNGKQLSYFSYKGGGGN